MRYKWFIGCKNGTRKAFRSLSVPTVDSHGTEYNGVLGPFKTKRAALWAEKQWNNPHFQNVNDAERLCKI